MVRGPGNRPWVSAVGRVFAAAGSAVVVLALAAPAYAVPMSTAGASARGAVYAPAGDGPAGFWYGTDSTTISITGSAPYKEPVIGGYYGGYIGMAGNWATWQGCGTKVVWSKTNAAQANTNYTTYHKGVGAGVYWFMGGPGVDPHYNGTTAEAYAWGRAQAARTRYDISKLTIKYPVVFMDIELPGNAPTFTPAPDNGWNAVYTSACSGRVKTNFVAPSLDRAVFNGFFDYIKNDTSFIPGVYSAPDVWASIFGNTSYASIPHTDEWTYEPFTSSLAKPPYGWCLRGTTTCARFFGGVSTTSSHALMWQWSGGGGSSNGYGDFDQIDANRQS
jgi:hypothetical protein